MQSITKLEHYFEGTMPLIIAKLPAETLPEWGTMNATQMLDHLNDALKLSMGAFPVTDEMIHEKWEKYKAIGLFSERPIAKNFTNPILSLMQKTDAVEHEQAKQNIQKGFVAFKQFYSQQSPGYTTIHNMFGRLNHHEWLWFHYKHFSHHFAQFGLVPYIDRFELE
jgi:oxepin-CoA hydrolase/3-oxo-5,6-dehydrosuberyl-CoA semialdehyde dehydrogenase